MYKKDWKVVCKFMTVGLKVSFGNDLKNYTKDNGKTFSETPTVSAGYVLYLRREICSLEHPIVLAGA